MKIVLKRKNDVCVGALSVNFTMLFFTWFVSHFTVGIRRLVIIVSRFLLDTFIANFLGIYRQLVAKPTPCDNGVHLVMGAGHVTEG